jgi:hypothetical protein
MKTDCELCGKPACGWTGVIDQLNNSARLKDQSVPEPILIAANGTILAGFGRWRLAILEGEREIECIEYSVSDEDSLQFILAYHRTRRWNPFVRIRLALTLEPSFQKKALDNMRAGGRHKGASNLTEAGKVDVRAEIAAAAGVSSGNVTKVKRVMRSATTEVVQALHNEEISIHRAWLWSQESPEKQRETLRLYQEQKGLKKTIRALLRRQQPKGSRMVVGLENLTRCLSTLDSTKFGPINVLVREIPGRTVVLSEELFRTTELQEERSLK